MLAVDLEATFVPGAEPGGEVLALWRRPPGTAAGTGTVELVLPAGKVVRRTQVSARLLPLAEALPLLVDLPADEAATRSLAAWAVAAKMAVDLVARGRLLPSVAAGGVATWRVGPLDPADHETLAALAVAMPPEAHAVPLAGSRPVRIRSAAGAISALFDAVADRLVRTPAAPMTGGGPLASTSPGPASPALAAWLAEAGSTAGDEARAGLRLSLPDGPDGTFTAVVQLRSCLDPSLVVDAADLWDAPGPVLARLGDRADTDLLLALRRAARAWPPVKRLLDEARPEVLILDDGEAEDLLGPAADALAAAGLEVLWPTDLVTAGIELRAVVATPTPTAVTDAGFNLKQLLEMRWEAVLDGMGLTAVELATLAEAKRPLVRLRGRWILADPLLLERLRRKPRRLSTAEALGAVLAGQVVVDGKAVDVHAEGALADLAERVGSASGVRELAEPAGLQAVLRPYQRRGLAWLAEMADLGLGGCLADDMGLGKTVQVIALHLHRRPAGAGPSLVICPASVLGNWERELGRFAPDVPVRRFHGGDRHLNEVAADEVVLATYGMIRRDHAALAELAWGLVVADEAQHVKNPLSRTARDLRTIPAGARIALTGTPVENRLSELWAILDWTTPGILGPLEVFRREVAVPVERHRDPEATAALSRRVAPFLLRRRKVDPGIAPELPPKTETDEIVPLTGEQATLYEAVARETLAEIAEAEGIGRRGLVLRLLTSLKQICNHPAQFLRERGPLPGRSGKLDALDDLLAAMLDAGESVLIFTQYVAMARLLERHLATQDIPTLFLHGSVPVRRRDEMVSTFQQGDVPVLLLSLKAGGTGLNLTQATQVVHYDRWWNPAVEDQASDRAWRIGQDRPVQVHRLVTEGTVEDRVAALLEVKRGLAEAVVGGGEAWLSELGDAELAELVALGSSS